jgi:hypothetical protein
LEDAISHSLVQGGLESFFLFEVASNLLGIHGGGDHIGELHVILVLDLGQFAPVDPGGLGVLPLDLGHLLVLHLGSHHHLQPHQNSTLHLR